MGCRDCKYGGVFGDALDMSYLEYRCSKLGDVRAYVGEADNSPPVEEIRRRNSECPHFTKKKLTANRRAKYIYIPAIISATSGSGYFFISSYGAVGVVFMLLVFVGMGAIISAIEGELGNF